VILPVAGRLPFRWLYPTGDKQTEIRRSLSHEKYFDAARIVAGDFHLIRRHLPPRLKNKIIVTNTVTAGDIEILRERGAAMLVTSTPSFDGRSFGTNVMEGVFAALGARRAADYRELLGQLNWQPRIEQLNDSPGGAGSTA
jgi:hypothetical protein